jgi:type III secretion protein T
MGAFADIDSMAAMGHSAEELLLLISLCSLRFFAALTVLPATGPNSIQGLTRGGLVVMLAGFVAFGLPLESVQHLSAAQWFGYALKETMIGLLIGFSAATVLWIAQCVGALIDTQTGYNNMQMTNPMQGEQSTPVSNILLQFVVTIFFMIGGMLAFLQVMFESFQVWPILAPLPSLSGTSDVFVIKTTDALMTGVVKFAAPVLIVLILIDLGFGLVARTAEKLEPMSLSQPIKGAVTMLMLALLVGLFIEQVRRYLIPTGLLERLQQMLS